MSAFNAYVHAKPDGSVFYVGKGTTQRARSFKRVYNLHYTNTVKKYGSNNILVGIMPCSSEPLAFELEAGLIKCFRRMGVALANMSDGGEGNSGAKWNAAQKAAKAAQTASITARKKQDGTYTPPRKKGYVMSVETRGKLSAIMKLKPATRGRTGMKNSPAHNAALRAANLGRKVPIEVREKISASSLGREASVATKQKMSEAHKRIWALRKLNKEQAA